nr:hypothetical protein Itr_chr11CG12020 [Ipomoea trifida]
MVGLTRSVGAMKMPAQHSLQKVTKKFLRFERRMLTREPGQRLGRNNRVGWIIESRPNIRNGVVSENEITGIVEAGEGYAAAGGVGGPDNGGRRSGAGGELKVAVGEEAESSGGVNGGGDPAGVPDGDFGVVGDCGEEGVGIRGDEGEGKGVIGRLPAGIRVGCQEGRARTNIRRFYSCSSDEENTERDDKC